MICLITDIVRIEKKAFSQLVLYIGISLLTSCSHLKDEKATGSKIQDIATEPVKVETIILSDRKFNQELITNAKIIAPQRATLRFQLEGNIESILVKDGQLVKKGEVIGLIDDRGYQDALKKAQLDYRKAQLDYEDQLLRLGYRPADTAKMEKELKENAKLRSGFSHAYFSLKNAFADIEKTRLTAPFTGKIANLNGKPFNATSFFENICTLVSTSSLDAEFKVLEQELPFVKNSKTISISLLGSSDYTIPCVLRSVNPIVDENGMVIVRVQLLIITEDLLDGMTVNLKCEQVVPDVIAIPKEALVDRQNKKVVFTVVNGKSHWNYVDIVDENSAMVAVKGNLIPGDEIIVKGNQNLSHLRDVITD